MKNTFKLTYLFALILLTTFSCSNDDEGTVEINLQDLEVTIDENPTDGQVIGTVQSDSSNSLTYSITSQTPSGALNIDASTGELTVADATLFDFETNPVITATVSAEEAVNMATVTVSVNNESELSTQDFDTTIDENPTDGQVLGAIQATGDGTLSFSITSQTPAGALNINATTGELTVADPNLFDFETNPVITADILVDNSGNTETVVATIALNDLDEVSAQNLNVAIDENPINGDVVGTIPATGGNLTFTITFQNPAGAFNINASTGELTVADATLFDFETNPNMLATVSVENSVNMVSVNATINLNNVDNIESLLSTSQAAYNAASDGDWVIITEAEYNSLANNLNAITRAGTTEAEYSNTFSSQISALNGSHTFSNYTTTSIIPNNGYVIAFKYKLLNATNAAGVKIKQSSTANNDGFSDLGNVLPLHSGSYEDVFFVLKGNNTSVTSNGYLGLFQPSTSMLLYDVTAGNGVFWGSGDTALLNGQLTTKKMLYQGLSTTQMQW